MFSNFVRHRFQNLPGEQQVVTGQYSIELASGRNMAVTRDNWNQVVFPGAALRMFVILSKIRLRAGKCPRPGCGHPYVYDEQVVVDWLW